MTTVRRMTLKGSPLKFPQLAPGVACIWPFIHLFDRKSARIVNNGLCIRITSKNPLTSFLEGAKNWEAWIYSDYVHMCATRIMQAAGPIGSWQVEERRRRKLGLLDFHILLHAIDSERQQEKSGLTNAPVRRLSRNKPCSQQRAKAY